VRKLYAAARVSMQCTCVRMNMVRFAVALNSETRMTHVCNTRGLCTHLLGCLFSDTAVCMLTAVAYIDMKSHVEVVKSINIFNVLGGNWDPTDKKFSSVNSYRQDLLPTCKAFPKETTTCIWFTQNHKVCNSTTVLQDVQML